MLTKFKKVVYEKKYDNGLAVVDHEVTKKSLYFAPENASEKIPKGAIEFLNFGEAIEQPFEGLLVGRTYEQAEYERIPKKKRNERAAYIMNFHRCIYKSLDPKKLEHVGIYDLSCNEPAIAKAYIDQHISDASLHFYLKGVLFHHPIFGTMVFTRHANSTLEAGTKKAKQNMTPGQEATYWILRRYSEEQNRFDRGGFKTAEDGTVMPITNTIPVTWIPTEGDEPTFHSSFAAKCSILQTLGYYVFDHATFYNEMASVTYNIHKPFGSNPLLQTLYTMPSASEGYAAIANMQEKILFVSRTRPADATVAANVEQDLLSLIGEWYDKDEWKIQYGTATGHEQFATTSGSSHLHFLVHDKRFPTDASVFFFAKAFGGDVEAALKRYNSDYQKRFAILSTVPKFQAAENTRDNNNNNNQSPLKKRKIRNDLLVPQQHVYCKNDQQVVEDLGSNLGWSPQYKAWVLEVPVVQLVEPVNSKKAWDRNVLVDNRERTGYCVGDKVKGFFSDDGKWYDATVVDIALTSLQVEWDDGDNKHRTHDMKGSLKPQIVEAYVIPEANYADATPVYLATTDNRLDRALKRREPIKNLYTRGVVDPLYVGTKNGIPHATLDGLAPAAFFQETKMQHPVLTCMINEPIEHTHANLMLSPYEDDFKFCDNRTLCVHTDFNRDVRCYPRFYAMDDIPAGTPLTWLYTDGEDPSYKIGYLPVAHPSAFTEQGKRTYVTYKIGKRNLSVAMKKIEVDKYKNSASFPLTDTMNFYKIVDRKATFANWQGKANPIAPTEYATRSYRAQETIALIPHEEAWTSDGTWIHPQYKFDPSGTTNNIVSYKLWQDEKKRLYGTPGQGRKIVGYLVAKRNILKGEKMIVFKSLPGE